MANIQVFRPVFRVNECLEEIRGCLEKGWTGIGYKTVEFEDRWKEYTGLNNAHFLNSATSGLHIAIRILKDKYKWEDKSEVITTPLTFVSTNHVILYENLVPVFADVDNSLNLSVESVARKINNKTKAIIFVGMGGNADNLLAIADLAIRKNIVLILDASHMAGTTIDGKHVGNEADVSVFSFQAVKNLPTADSGMICFKDKNLDKKARELSWLGINKDTFRRNAKEGNYIWNYDVSELGYKYHGNSIIASIGIISLKYLDEDNSRRREIANKYIENFKSYPQIEIIKHRNCTSSRHLFQIIVKNRDKVLIALNEKGIFPGVHYRINTDYSLYEYARGDSPNAQYYSGNLLSLPIHLQLTNKDINFVSESIIELVKSYS